jgi:hypothetical protein
VRHWQCGWNLSRRPLCISLFLHRKKGRKSEHTFRPVSKENQRDVERLFDVVESGGRLVASGSDTGERSDSGESSLVLGLRSRGDRLDEVRIQLVASWVTECCQQRSSHEKDTEREARRTLGRKRLTEREMAGDESLHRRRRDFCSRSDGSKTLNPVGEEAEEREKRG